MRRRRSIYEQAMERERKERDKHARPLSDYKIDVNYIKGGTAAHSARGYRDMRQTRGEIYRGSRKYKGGRAYRIRVVNTTKGRIVK
jgi:hypothetical protein